MKSKIVVGSYSPLPYTREELEIKAGEYFSPNYIEQLSDKELFDMYIKEYCRRMNSEEE